MKTKQQAIREQIDEIMDTFDFERVHRIMERENWEWRGEGVPDIVLLRKAARELLISAAEHGASATGGFSATRDEDTEDGKPWIRLNLVFGPSTCNDGTEYDQ